MIILSDAIYVPAEDLDPKQVKKQYRHRFYEEQDCRRCENRPERHNYLCNKCPAFTDQTVVYKERSRHGIPYIGLPFGDRDRIEDLFSIDFHDYEIKDFRCKAKRRHKIEIEGLTPYDNQRPAIKDLGEYRYGILKAPPRSGKTPTMLYAAVKEFPYRIVMIADQREFLDQFLDHVREYTNLPELEERHKKKLFGYARTIEDMKNFEIAVCTYQTFLSEGGKKLLAALNKNFGTMLLDECHSAAAPQYSGIINSIKCAIRIGATGTVERKDKRHKIIKQIIGDVTAEINVDQLRANIYVHIVDFTKSRAKYVGKGGFSRLINFLSDHEKRNELIIEWAVKDIKAGHSIIIPVERKEHLWYMVKRINDEMGQVVAAGFEGATSKAAKAARAKTLDDARSGKIRAVVGIKSLLRRGLNVPRWSMLYNITPSNNEPNWKQESSRILTPMEGKRQPGIRFFVDENLQMPLNCFVNTYKQTVKFKHIPTKTARERFSMMARKLGDLKQDRRTDSALLEGDMEVFKEEGLFS